jgi:hypothetical protein
MSAEVFPMKERRLFFGSAVHLFFIAGKNTLENKV